MILIRLSEVIRDWMGWCPNADVSIRNTVVRYNNEEITVPSAGRTFKGRTIHWLSQFRNQILLFTIMMSATGFWMFADLSRGSYPLLFICGIFAGLLVSAVIGIWYWRIFNEVLHEGPVILWNRYDKTSGTIAVVSLVIVTAIPALAITGAIPGVSLEMTNTVFGGFMAVVFWGQFASIWMWESEHHKTLRYDGMILKLEKEENHAPC